MSNTEPVLVQLLFVILFQTVSATYSEKMLKFYTNLLFGWNQEEIK